MSSGNPRGKPRRNGSIPEYGGQHIVGGQVPTAVMPPGQPPQSLVNGNAGQQPVSFVIPSVDNTHPPHNTGQFPTVTRIPPRNLPNPSMQFAPGEVHVEGARPQQGNHQITIHPVPQQARYQAQPVPSQQNYSTSQMAYPSAPPNSMYGSNVIYGAHNFIPNNPQSFYYPPMVPQAAVYSYFPAAQPTDYINPAAAAAAARMNVSYNQNPMLLQAAAAAAPPAAPSTTTVATGIATSVQAQQQQPAKTKKILSIVDPVTNEVTNKDDIIRSEMEQQQQLLQQNIDSTDSSKFYIIYT